MQSGSSSQSGRNRGAAVEADAIEEQQLEADAIGELLKSGKNQLKRTQSGSSSSAQRALRRRITHVDERGGSS